MAQQKNNLPLGPYVFAISVTSPFIKFKNASKETVDASEELVEEIRRTLMQTGQKLARHIRREKRADELERKTQYIKQFVPILVKKLGDITKANKKRQDKATKGIMKLLGQDTKQVEEALKTAEDRLKDLKNSTSEKIKLSVDSQDKLPSQMKTQEDESSTKEVVKDTSLTVGKKTGKNPSAKKKSSVKEKSSTQSKKITVLQKRKKTNIKTKMKHKGLKRKLKRA